MRIHNITDREATPGSPRAMQVAGRTIRPGKFTEIPSEDLGRKIRIFHGNALWFGDVVPPALNKRKTVVVPPVVSTAMDAVEARHYLDARSEREMRELAAASIPPMEIPAGMARVILIARLARFLFQPGRVLDPQKFFWLRRWVKQGDTYIEKE